MQPARPPALAPARGDARRRLLAAEAALAPLLAGDDGASWLPFVAAAQADTRLATVSVHRETALHAAAEHLRPRYAGLLLARGADVNARGPDGAAPLHAVVQDRRAQIGVGGVTPLGELLPGGLTGRGIEALEREVARVLLRGGARLDARDQLGETPLAHAARYGRAELLRVMLEAAAVEVGEAGGAAEVPGWARPGAGCVVDANTPGSLLRIAVEHHSLPAVVVLCATGVRLVEDRTLPSLREITAEDDLLEIDQVLRANGL